MPTGGRGDLLPVCNAREVIGKASHKAIREAIASAKLGDPSMLEASADLSLDNAVRFAERVISEDEEAQVLVSAFTKGPWLHVVPVASQSAENL